MGQLLFVANGGGAGGGANLQVTYDVGPSGLIVTDATGPVGVDDLRFEDSTITNGNSGGDVLVQAAASTTGNGGAIQLTGGLGFAGSGTGGGINIQAGFGAIGGDVIAVGGDDDGSSGGDGGQFVARGGDSVGNTGGKVTVVGGIGGSIGGDLFLSSGQGVDQSQAGLVRISLARGQTDISGGLTVTPANAHVTLKTFPVDGVIPTGSLIVHILDEDGETAQSPYGAGMIHFREEQGAGTDIRVGFRASKENGAIGLLARIYSLPFTSADLDADVLTVTHNLDTAAPLVMIYDDAGLLQGYPSESVISITRATDNATSVEFSPGTPGGGQTWWITIVGI